VTLTKGLSAFLGRNLLENQVKTNDELSQIMWLERENARLQQLVAELLVKNEQLRQMYLAISSASNF
jgi:hypothetical protein